MILFTKESKTKILAGEKTQTRRLWYSRRCVPGALHYAQTSRDSKSRFALLRIIKVWSWDGWAISHEDVLAEGFKNANEFRAAYYVLNHRKLNDNRRKHFAVEFELVEEITT